MKTSCELPITLLGANRLVNDYDFVLFHLLRDHPEYRDYWTKYPRGDRQIILDNSGYEFFVKGEGLDLPQFADAIKQVHPTQYILPDFLMDKDRTLKGVEYWMRFYAYQLPDDIQPIAVVQGNSESDFDECLDYYITKLGIRYIAFPFHNSFYFYNGAETKYQTFMGDDYLYAIGRVILIKSNIEMWRGKYGPFQIHLLGSHDAMLEGKLLKDVAVTMDTGYPVKCGIAGMDVEKAKKKPDIIIDNFINNKFTPYEADLILSNVIKFRNICK